VIRVVVVDDEALVRSGFELILNSSDGIQVVATAAGAQAADVIRREHPDVVLLDIRMPDVDGLTVQRELAGLALPLIFITAHDVPEARDKALNAGAIGYLRKPFNTAHLVALVRSVMP